jgi:oligopeptide/dipeptide ABC transporter ATP-binding protein
MMEVLLEVNNLKKYFKTPHGMLHAVDDISFKLEKGKTLGVVGESGCGKSTLGRVILHLIEPTDGTIIFEGKDITNLKGKALKSIHKEMQMIFQDPYSSINPRMRVRDLIGEPLKTHKLFKTKQEYDSRIEELMETVGIDNRIANSYPHELDGGRRQRVGVARALSLNPKFIVCDEPVSALDVSIQAQILNLLMDLQDNMGLTYIFISHDLSVVKHISDDICVMYLGNMVEKCEVKEIFKNHLHPYTKALISAIPVPKINFERNKILLKGEVTSPINPKPGCRFAPRCQYASQACFEEQPLLEEVLPGHFVACHRVRVINDLC